MNERYWARMEYLRNRIQDQQILKEAQVPYGADYDFFQNEITFLTNELRRWERNIDGINKLEVRITNHNRRVRAAERDALRAAGTWSRLATVCGPIGALPLALDLQWSLGLLLPGVGIGLLVLAGVALLMSMRARTSAAEVVARAHPQLVAMLAERDALIPPVSPTIDPFPRFSYEVIVR